MEQTGVANFVVCEERDLEEGLPEVGKDVRIFFIQTVEEGKDLAKQTEDNPIKKDIITLAKRCQIF